jgi:hypothetical protein
MLAALSCAAPLAAGCGHVTRQGAELRLDGAPFRVLGGNLYYLQQDFTYGQSNPAMLEQATRALDDVGCFSTTVVRTLAFNDPTTAPPSAPRRGSTTRRACWAWTAPWPRPRRADCG